MQARPRRNDRRTRTTYGPRRASARIMEESIAMRISPRPSALRHHIMVWLTAIVLAAPSVAAAQYGAPELNTGVPAEQYHFEVAGTIWNPTVSGIVSSQRLG